MLNIKRFILSAVIIFCTMAMILPCTAAAVSVDAVAIAAQSYNPDYSNPASQATIELTPSEFTELLTGEALSEAEKEYIDKMLIGNPFKYNNAVPPSCVQTAYDNNTLEITAAVYSYTAPNGTTVKWIPNQFVLVGTEHSGALTLDADSGKYTATVNSLSENSDAAAVELSYTCAISVKGEEADTYINYAYNSAKGFEAQEKDYESELAAYNAYQDYKAAMVEYEDALIPYKAYLEEKAAYDKKYAEYTEYLDDLKAYRENQVAYAQYLKDVEQYKKDDAAYQTAYAEYVKKLNAYTSEKLKYDAYAEELKVRLDCMTTIESVFIAGSNGRMLYTTIMGDTVAEVVSRKAELVAGGGNAELIDLAGTSTNNLQNLLTGYKNKKTTAEKLAYYQAHYSELKKNFADLYGALYAMVRTDKTGDSANLVITVLKQKDKYEKYIDFVIQLYAVTSGLDDSQTRDSNLALFTTYNVALKKPEPHTVNTDLEAVHRPADKNNANPAGITLPDEVPSPGAAPTVGMEKPTEPKEVKPLLEPDPVNEPTDKPAVVPEPNKPAEVPAVDQKPAEPSFSEKEKAILDMLKNGTLKKRTATERALTFETKISKPVSLLNKRHALFYDYDGNLLYSQELELGDEIKAPENTPTRAETAAYSYAFEGWKNEDGEFVDDFGVADEIYKVFYASYTETIKQYEVKWVVGDDTTTQKYDYGKKPEFGAVPTKEATAQYTYRFRGWRASEGNINNKELPPVVADITYEAVFEEVLRYYTITWAWGKDGKITATDYVAYGTMPHYGKTPAAPEDGKFIYTFKGWDKEFEEVTGDVIYTAVYDKTPIITVPDSEQEVEVVTKGDTYKVNVPDSGLNVDKLLTLATEKDKRIEFTSNDQSAKMVFNEAIISGLSQAGCAGIAMKTDVENGKRIEVIFSDAEGQSIQLSTAITLQYVVANKYTKAYILTEDNTLTPVIASVDGNIMSMKLSKSETVVFRDEYTVEVSSLENGMLTADVNIAYEGQTVKLTAVFSDEYQVAYLKVIGKISGTEYTVSADGSFVMPSEPVTVSGALELRKFTVKFVVDGVVISEREYHLGDKVEIPADPAKEGSEELVYTFTGWSPTVTTVSGDVTYTAVFSETQKSGADLYIPDDVKDFSFILYLEIAAVLLVLTALIATPIVLVKRRKKRKKAAKQENDKSADKSKSNKKK